MRNFHFKDIYQNQYDFLFNFTACTKKIIEIIITVTITNCIFSVSNFRYLHILVLNLIQSSVVFRITFKCTL